jgi:hypothetical protein
MRSGLALDKGVSQCHTEEKRKIVDGNILAQAESESQADSPLHIQNSRDCHQTGNPGHLQFKWQ